MGTSKAGPNILKVLLDPENDSITMKSGVKLAVDTSYDPEKHMVRTGVVTDLPVSLVYSDKGDRMPWVTEQEIRVGDRVVMYYMAVMNCLSKEQKKFIKQDGKTWIFINYHNLYAVIRDGEVLPINGYVFFEPVEDPAWLAMVEKAEKAGLSIPFDKKPSLTDVSYGRIAYMGKKIDQYYEEQKCDDGYDDLKVGDVIILRKIRDIPIEYELHAKVDHGRKLMRTQRFNILAKV